MKLPGKLATAQSDITTAKSDIAANAASIGDANKAIAQNKNDLVTANGKLSTAPDQLRQVSRIITTKE